MKSHPQVIIATESVFAPLMISGRTGCRERAVALSPRRNHLPRSDHRKPATASATSRVVLLSDFFQLLFRMRDQSAVIHNFQNEFRKGIKPEQTRLAI